jgi:hypothetical protein
MRITKFETHYNKLSFRMTTRIDSAIDMYNMMLKLNTEQETSGSYDILIANISEICEGKEFGIDIYPEMFPGRADVIFELCCTINIHSGSKLDIQDIDTEQVLGTIFKEIRDHFDFYYKSYPDSVRSEVVKHHFRGY